MKIKNTVAILFVLLLSFFVFAKLEGITNIIAAKIIMQEPSTNEVISSYKNSDTLSYVINTDSFIPYSRQDLLNIIFTSMNNGWSSLSFYCPSQYKECINDAVSISKDQTILTHINNFVHPYNSFDSMKITISSTGEINISANYLYSQEMINKINSEVRNIISKQIKNDSSEYEKIKTVHDYIINHSAYDVERNNKKTSPYSSHLAYGPLFEGYGICSGYADLMAIFLHELNFKNFKISTTPEELPTLKTGHVWNAVFTDNKWLHLDLTWDDPVSNDNKQYLYHTYFLISSKELLETDKGKIDLGDEHNFNKQVYFELADESSK